MNTVLAAIDSSPFSNVVAEYACDLASLAGASVRAAYVVDTRLTEGLIGRVLTALLESHPDAASAVGQELGARVPVQEITSLADLLERLGAEALRGVEGVCRRRGVAFQQTVERGRPPEALAALAPRYDLAVLGGSGSGDDFRSSLVGSTTADFLRLTTRPALIVRREHRPIRRVLVGYDESPEATRALAAVLPLAAAGEWSLTIAIGGDEAEAIASRVTSVGGIGAVSHDVALRPGEHQYVAHVLLNLAHELSTDMIVVGSRGLSKLARLAMGSTSDTLVREAPVPVMVFK